MFRQSFKIVVRRLSLRRVDQVIRKTLLDEFGLKVSGPDDDALFGQFWIGCKISSNGIIKTRIAGLICDGKGSSIARTCTLLEELLLRRVGKDVGVCFNHTSPYLKVRSTRLDKYGGISLNRTRLRNEHRDHIITVV